MSRPPARGAPRFAVACALTLAVGASSALPAESQVVRDSLGVRIVEHRALPAGLTGLIVDPVPSLRLGSSFGGSGPDVFGRIVYIAELTDGTIVVSDGSVPDVRAFDAEGRHLWTVGSAGDEPGEFRGVQLVSAMRGDSILAVDLVGGRVSVLDRTGAVRRRFQLDVADALGGELARVAGARTNGSVISLSLEPTGPPARPLGTRSRTPLPLVDYDPSGRFSSEIGRFPGRESVIATPPRGRAAAGGGGLTSLPLEMGAETVVAVGGDRVAVGTQERFEIREYDSSGRLFAIVRVANPPVAPDRTRFVENGLAGVTDESERARVRRNREAVQLAEYLPAHGRILLGPRGELWVEEYVPPYEGRQGRWFVFDADGLLVGTVALPSEFDPMTVGSTHVLGRRLGEFQVPFVEKYAVRGPPP